MKNASHLKQIIHDLFLSQRLAVLATNHGGHPYSSLVAFVATEDLKSFLFATARETRKYANIKADPRVSLLVDNRLNRATDFRETIAVTVLGKAEDVANAEKDKFMKLYLEKHPYLKEFVTSPTCALLKVIIERYLIVNRFQHVRELHVTQGLSSSLF